MSDDNSSSSTDVFTSLLTVLFIGLKLTGHIAWSWWWVMSPLWGPVTAVLVIAASVILIGSIMILIGKAFK